MNPPVHFIGIGGAGMSAIARILIERGEEVWGSDLKASPATDALQSLGARVSIGHRADNVDGAATVVFSAAIAPTNVELVRAQEHGIPIMTRGEALAELVNERAAIVVCGTHGKTTTTSMIVAILTAAGHDPTYLVGGGLNDSGTNAHTGRGHYLVVEADESDGSFLLLESQVAVVTNIEIDHVDHWRSLDELRTGFHGFLARVRPGGSAVVPADDELATIALPDVTMIKFGPGGAVTADEIRSDRSGSSFVLGIGESRFQIALQVPGSHNIANALAAAAAAHAVGVGGDEIAFGLGAFSGVERRFQERGSARGVTVIDDYAHHPTEVKATLAAARNGRWERVVAVFQPHRYSRTAVLGAAFGDAFGDADRVVVTDVYGAGEEPIPGVTGKLIVDAIATAEPGLGLAYIPHRRDLVAFLASTVRSGDLVLTLGAGDISTIGGDLLAQMETRG